MNASEIRTMANPTSHVNCSSNMSDNSKNKKNKKHQMNNTKKKLLGTAITATCLINGVNASTNANNNSIVNDKINKSTLKSSSLVSSKLNMNEKSSNIAESPSLRLPFTQVSAVHESILFGVRSRGGDSSSKGTDSDNNSGDNDSGRNYERNNLNLNPNRPSENGSNSNNNKYKQQEQETPDEDIHENIEKTKLSFSTISQAEKKKRKTKKKKKKTYATKSTGTGSNHNSAKNSKDDKKEIHNQKRHQQPPPPNIPPPPSTSTTQTKTTTTSTTTTQNGNNGKSTTTKKETIIEQILKTDDYYQILNVSKSSLSSSSSNKTQITKAYRRQAVITHPDKNNGNREAFDKVREAYDVLKDDMKRKIYDQYGIEGVKNPDLVAAAEARGNGSGYFSKSGAGSTLQEQIFKNFFGATSSPYGRMFGNQFYSSGSGGGGMNSRQQHQQQKAKNENVKYELQVSLEDLYNGKHYDLEILLPSSSSSSYSPSKTRKSIQVEVPRGMLNQQSIRYSGYIDTISEATPADLIFIVKQKYHSIYTRKGFDLVMEVRLSFKEAICGFERTITHLDGREITICNPYFLNQGKNATYSSSKDKIQNRPNIIQTSDVHVLRGEGMPKFNWAEKKSSDSSDGNSRDVNISANNNLDHHNHYHNDKVNKQYGDLYVQYVVEMPTSTDGENTRKIDEQNNILTPEERETLGVLLDKLYGKEKVLSSKKYDHHCTIKEGPLRLEISTASDFGRASGTPPNLDDDDDQDSHLYSTPDDDHDGNAFGFDREGFQYFSRGHSGRHHHGASSFFSGGFGSSFAGTRSGSFHREDDDDGNVQCHQM